MAYARVFTLDSIHPLPPHCVTSLLGERGSFILGTKERGMAKKSATATILVREAYPSHLLFEERDGIYWLRGQDLALARNILPIKSDADSVGFDKATMSAYASKLNQKRIKVGILKDNAVRTLQFQRPKKPVNVPSTTISLAPELLLGKRELERLEGHLTRKRSHLKDLAEGIRTELSNGHRTTVADFGKLYVYEAWEGAYEVDWELTTLSKTIFEALALATHQTGRKLVCQLVPPKPTRKKNRANPGPLALVGAPVTYGQLRLPL
jgi:hypothetical protein